MVLNLLSQLKTKKTLLLDAVLYFVAAVFLALIICYFIFSIKISLQQKEIKKIEEQLVTTSSAEQKTMEDEVFKYQKKIGDFTSLLNSHELSSNLFEFLQRSTYPKVWYSDFNVNTKETGIKLAGDTDDLGTLARQVSIFEESEFVKEITVLNFELSSEGKIKFKLSLSLDPKVCFTAFEQ